MRKLSVGLFYCWGLDQHGSNCDVRCIGMDVKLQFPVDSNKDGSILVPGLDILVSIFALGSPIKSFSFSCKPSRFHDARIIFNKTSVELCQSVESLNGLDIFWWGHIDQGLNFFWVWKFTGLADDIA